MDSNETLFLAFISARLLSVPRTHSRQRPRRHLLGRANNCGAAGSRRPFATEWDRRVRAKAEGRSLSGLNEMYRSA